MTDSNRLYDFSGLVWLGVALGKALAGFRRDSANDNKPAGPRPAEDGAEAA